MSNPITPSDIARLREAALSTSGDEWTSDVWHESDGCGWRATGPHHEDTDEDDSSPGCPAEQRAQLDAAFIRAASPSTVLALLDQLAATQAALTELLEAVGAFHDLADRDDNDPELTAAGVRLLAAQLAAANALGAKETP